MNRQHLTQHIEHKNATIDDKSVEFYAYKDKEIIAFPADLPRPHTDTFCCMFSNCDQLQDITALSNWDASSVKEAHYMFYGCSRLQGMIPI